MINPTNQTIRLIATFSLLLTLPTSAADRPVSENPTSHQSRQLQGWTVRIDDRLLDPANDALAKRALQLLEAQLADIKSVVAADRLARLQAVTIVLDLTHGDLRSMQYHPGAGWLIEHGYSKDLAKCVHIPDAAAFINPRTNNAQPWCVLHELAHSYHDQVLGFDEPRIRQAYENFNKSGHGDATLLYDGRKVKHYALTNQMEFFAEMSEAYFGANDFFPFNRAELKTAEPEIFALLEKVWGQPFKGHGMDSAQVSTQFNTRRLDFAVGDHRAFILLPNKPTADGSRPWIWYAPTFIGQLPDPSHEWLFTRLLNSGFAIAGIDVGESYGNPKGREIYSQFHKLLTDKFALNSKACLLAQSRGGLMLYNWAAEHPQQVQCIGAIYPVCDQSSWPGLAKSAPAYNMTEDELKQHLEENNPIDRLEPLAKAKIPILHLHGNIDKVVPLEQNSGELSTRYQKLGGDMKLITIEGKGHEVCPEFSQSKELLEFFRTHGETGPQKDAGN
jgi:hypothetical protein